MLTPISESVLSSGLESSCALTESHLLFSQTIQNFCSEITSFSSLFGIGCGQIIAPFVRFRSARLFTQLLGNSQEARFISSYASLAFSLGAEGVGMHVGTQFIRNGKIEEGALTGSLNATLTIIACKTVGKVAPPNIIMVHLAQDGAMVAMEELTARIGLSEKTNGSLSEKLLHAEVTAIQMECSATFVKIVAPQVSYIHAKCELNDLTKNASANYLKEKGRSFKEALNSVLPLPPFATASANQDGSIRFNRIHLLERKIDSDSQPKTEKRELSKESFSPPLSQRTTAFDWVSLRSYLMNHAFQHITPIDLLVAGSLMFTGCNLEGTFGSAVSYLLLKGSGIPQRLLKSKSEKKSLSAPQKNREKETEESKIFRKAIYEFADFLNEKDVHGEQIDPYLFAVHQKRELLITAAKELFPESMREERKALFLGDLLRTSLLLSKTSREFEGLLDILLTRIPDLKTKLDSHLSTFREETETRGVTPDNFSGPWINILIEILKEELPSELSSVSTNRRYKVDPQASTPERGPLDHIFLERGFVDPPYDIPDDSSLSRTGLPPRRASDMSIGSAITPLVPMSPSSLTQAAHRSFLSKEGPPIINVAVIQDSDINAHVAPLLQAFPPELRITNITSIRSGRRISASMLMTETSLMSDDLIRLEEEPPSLHEGKPTPIVEILRLKYGVSRSFRMETSLRRFEETQIAKLYSSIFSREQTSHIIQRAFFRPNSQLLGTIETMSVNRKLLQPLLYFSKPPSIERWIGSVSITDQWVETHRKSVYFLEKGNYRAILRGLCYELICYNDNLFDPHEPHAAEFVFTGVKTELNDFLDFFMVPTHEGKLISVFNLAQQCIFQMLLTSKNRPSSLSPIIASSRSALLQFPSSARTVIPGSEGTGPSGDTLIESEESRETLGASGDSFNQGLPGDKKRK